MDRFGRRLSDLEGLTIDNGGAVYAITSHSMTNDIERAPDREHLVRFRVQAGSVTASSSEEVPPERHKRSREDNRDRGL